MPCLSFNFNLQIGPLLQVTVFPANHNPAQMQNQGAPFTPTMYAALIDTGASCTCISNKVISALNLQPVSKQPVGGVHGSKPTNLYQFTVGLVVPAGVPNAIGAVQANVVTVPILGTEFVPGQAPFDILLGRDVLCQGVFTMSFDGHASFAI